MRPRSHVPITKELGLSWLRWQKLENVARVGRKLELDQIQANSIQREPTQAKLVPIDTQLHRSCELGSNWLGLGGPSLEYVIEATSCVVRQTCRTLRLKTTEDVDSPLLLWFVSLTGAKGKGYGSFQEEAIRIFNSLKEQESMADPIPVIQVKPRPNERNMLRATMLHQHVSSV